MWKSLRRNWGSDELDKGNQPISKELHDSFSLKVELMEKKWKSVDGSTAKSAVRPVKSKRRNCKAEACTL